MAEALRLFLIEDDDNIALLIRRALADHQVIRCRTAADALIVLAQSTFDLVLLDHLLPDMTGFELLQRLTREGISVPVLMVTGEGDEHLATQVLHAGALDYLVKDPYLSFLVDLPKRVCDSVRRHQLEQMNQLLIQALESARDGVMITDLQGTILEVNAALEELTGYSRHELIGQNPRLFNSGSHPPEFFRKMWLTILARHSWQGELTNRRKDGQLRQTSMTISPIVDRQGRLTHFVGIQRDITEQQRLEHQLMQMQKLQSVGTLAGGIAHEFNNLMAGIHGYASLGLREPQLDPTLREFLQHIVTLSDRAANLTRQLLAFARKPALVRKSTRLVDLLRTTAELVHRTLHQPVDLEFPSAVGVFARQDLVVEADANQLQQALVNLALNARDAIRERSNLAESTEQASETSITDHIIFALREEVVEEPRTGFPQNVPPGSYVVVEVRDKGMGMEPEVLTQALDPFYTTKEVGQGTGLGLPMVYGIVQGHQGILTIDTKVGMGTTVTLYLPRYEENRGEPAPLQVRDTEFVEPEAWPGRGILVIDDEEAVVDVVRRFLEIAGHKVRCVTTGKQGLEEAYSAQPLDLVILDLMMPGEDSQMVFQRIRQRHPSIPILLCTGLADAEPAPRILSQTNTGLLRKPFRMNELWYAVRKALNEADREVPPLIP